MIIAAASGKGGTGKTTFSTSLALAVQSSCVLADCDVEEPNSGIFLTIKEDISGKSLIRQNVEVPIPVIDESICTGCGICAKACQFNAVICLGKKAMIFPELCHSCGACAMLCPVHAIHEEPSVIGTLTTADISKEGGFPLTFIEGELQIGRAMSPPVIRAVKKKALSFNADIVVIDSPPGTSCPMCTAVDGSDFIVLVTEPTPFGLHDLDLAVKTVRTMNIPFGVVINRCDSGDSRTVEYCKNEKIPILMEIPEDRRIARGYSEGIPLIVSAPEYTPLFASLPAKISELLSAGGM